jgi:hypothetical protein
MGGAELEEADVEGAVLCCGAAPSGWVVSMPAESLGEGAALTTLDEDTWRRRAPGERGPIAGRHSWRSRAAGCKSTSEREVETRRA